MATWPVAVAPTVHGNAPSSSKSRIMKHLPSPRPRARAPCLFASCRRRAPAARRRARAARFRERPLLGLGRLPRRLREPRSGRVDAAAGRDRRRLRLHRLRHDDGDRSRRRSSPGAPTTRGWSTDDEIRRAVDLARENNLKVILKPVVNCDDGVWRAWVKFYRPVTDEERAAGTTGELDPWADAPVMRDGQVRDLAKWDQWWQCFRGFLLHYAKIAEDEDVEMLCLGCEMNSTEEFDDRWRALIAEIRAIYHGAITYDVNHGRESQVAWWDAVDVISVSAYYQVPPPEGQTIEAGHPDDDAQGRNPRAAPLEQAGAGRPRARSTTSRSCSSKRASPTSAAARDIPWSHPDAKLGDPLDQQEQVNYYEAMFEAFWDEPWFMGFAWWDWPARLYDREAAAEHRGFCIYGKPAEEVVRHGTPSHGRSPRRRRPKKPLCRGKSAVQFRWRTGSRPRRMGHCRQTGRDCGLS